MTGRSPRVRASPAASATSSITTDQAVQFTGHRRADRDRCGRTSLQPQQSRGAGTGAGHREQHIDPHLSR
jgi:hypothetical protein